MALTRIPQPDTLRSCVGCIRVTRSSGEVGVDLFIGAYARRISLIDAQDLHEALGEILSAIKEKDRS